MSKRLFTAGVFAMLVAGTADATTLKLSHQFSEGDVRNKVAQMIAGVTGFKGKITCDTSKPDGAMRKLMDVGRLSKMGWNAQIDLRDGLARTYTWYLAQLASGAAVRAK